MKSWKSFYSLEQEVLSLYRVKKKLGNVKILGRIGCCREKLHYEISLFTNLMVVKKTGTKDGRKVLSERLSLDSHSRDVTKCFCYQPTH